jgi:hypothetical protein
MLANEEGKNQTKNIDRLPTHQNNINEMQRPKQQNPQIGPPKRLERQAIEGIKFQRHDIFVVSVVKRWFLLRAELPLALAAARPGSKAAPPGLRTSWS